MFEFVFTRMVHGTLGRGCYRHRQILLILTSMHHGYGPPEQHLHHYHALSVTAPIGAHDLHGQDQGRHAKPTRSQRRGTSSA
jgi:hypothetical protein